MSHPEAGSSPVDVSIVIPMHNEAGSLEELFGRLTKVMDAVDVSYEIVCVDDGSKDNTWEQLRSRQTKSGLINAIRLSRNFGKEIAMSAGLDHAKGSAVIFIDADLQDPPELITEFIDHWHRGYQNVYGLRIDRTRDTFMKRSTSNAFYKLFNVLSNTSLPANAGDFRLLGEETVAALRECRERHRFMKGLYAWVGFPSVAVPYERPERLTGSTKFGAIGLWNLALEGIFSHSTVLLRAWTYIGFIAIFCTLLLGVWVFVEYFISGNNPPGFYLTLLVILGFSSFNFVMLGILGEYVGRIYDEVKQRPLYLIRNDDIAP